MSHACGRASSEKTFSSSNKPSKHKDKNSCSVTTLTADAKRFSHSNKCDSPHKTKRLKTHKERNQIRGGWKEISKTKSSHRHCHCQSRKEAVFFQNCCHNSCQRGLKRNTQISHVVPATQEPSIITDSRLIGHHGLFNHEVKSIDIERLLNKQSKLKQSEQKRTEKNSNLSSASHVPAQLSSDGLSGADAVDVGPVRKEADSDVKTFEDSQETQGKNIQESDITPGQRPQQQPDVSSGPFKSTISSEHSPHSAETNTKTSSYFTTKKERKSQLTPSTGADNVKTLNSKETRHMTSDTEQPLKNQDHQARADGLKSCPLQLCSTAEDKPQDPADVSETINAVATRLCESLYLPFPRRSLLSESKKMLQKALQEKHGPWLQENLERLRRLGSDNPTRATLDRGQSMMEEDEIPPSGTAFKTTGSRQFIRLCSPQLHHSLQQTAVELPNPVDTSVHFMDETFKPSFPHHFDVDFNTSEAAANDPFAHSPKLFQEEKASSPELWEGFMSKSEESAPFESFQDSFMTHTRKVGVISSEMQRNNSINPFISHQGHAAGLIQFTHDQDRPEADRCSFPSLFPNRSHQHHQSNSFQHFDNLSSHPTFRPSNTDMMLYPPSHTLETRSAPPSSESPEHWSFPPMRLY